ncbi:MAG: hypothetical protein JWR69_395, partial [Pedosphaera sp.]|nr:hypothetical protein [Pedosphaera sp.]
MELLKKHYEKVVLGVVLLGLTVAVALLPVILGSKRAKLTEMHDVLTHPKIKELPPLDLALPEAALQRVQAVARLDFTRNHNLFNPVLWLKSADGRPVKASSGPQLGPEKMEITAIKPLYLQLSFNSVSGNSYLIGVENEAAASASKRKGEKLASKDNKNDLFTLREVRGPAEKPTELVLELNETSETITIAPGKPFRRVDGYSADLRYPPENKPWRDVRSGAALNFAGGQYNIV